MNSPYQLGFTGVTITPSEVIFAPVMCVNHWDEVNHFFASYALSFQFSAVFLGGGILLGTWQNDNTKYHPVN